MKIIRTIINLISLIIILVVGVVIYCEAGG